MTVEHYYPKDSLHVEKKKKDRKVKMFFSRAK